MFYMCSLTKPAAIKIPEGIDSMNKNNINEFSQLEPFLFRSPGRGCGRCEVLQQRKKVTAKVHVVWTFTPSRVLHYEYLLATL